jgi:glycine/D-amino acid oxidase-like deaminating enzyme
VHSITILEATAIASGASGKAGGLLGLWAYPQALVPLSYRLHAELAAEHDGPKRWGYRRVQCGSVAATVSKERVDAMRRNSNTSSVATASVKPLPTPAASESDTPSEDDTKDWEMLPKQNAAAVKLLGESVLPAGLDWLDKESIEGYREMGDPGTTETAQVHPFHFTTSIAALAQEKGVDIRIGAKVTKINHAKGEVDSVEYLDRETGQIKTICNVTDVVVSAGPWTGRLLPKSRIETLRAHSVVWDAEVTPYAVFTDIALPADYNPEHRAKRGQKRRHKGNVDPEIYARPFSEVYACGW